mmetsp:Transcript_3324/g.4489  ORF Transcript_3324/g.4489 Transcript_3324/m.4489 type:complete len:136 (-) Transcript_3324:1765-2172(-)
MNEMTYYFYCSGYLSALSAISTKDCFDARGRLDLISNIEYCKVSRGLVVNTDKSQNFPFFDTFQNHDQQHHHTTHRLPIVAAALLIQQQQHFTTTFTYSKYPTHLASLDWATSSSNHRKASSSISFCWTVRRPLK